MKTQLVFCLLKGEIGTLPLTFTGRNLQYWLKVIALDQRRVIKETVRSDKRYILIYQSLAASQTCKALDFEYTIRKAPMPLLSNSQTQLPKTYSIAFKKKLFMFRTHFFIFLIYIYNTVLNEERIISL